MKTTYIRPLCGTVLVQHESMMQSTSREAEAGTPSSPNANSDHYKDPTSPIDMKDGGESLSKGCYIWEDLDDWV